MLDMMQAGEVMNSPRWGLHEGAMAGGYRTALIRSEGGQEARQPARLVDDGVQYKQERAFVTGRQMNH